MVESGSNSNTHTECRSSSLDPPPRTGSRTEQKVWAWRRYHGLGPDGAFVEKWTQQEVADALGVSRQSVDRWLNREETPLVEGLSEFERWAFFAHVMRGDEEKLEEYFVLRRLEECADGSIPVSGEDDDEPEETPFPEGFSW